eukprot:TRINITY_DN63322_c0_g1_i1.p1 TRINITY_DN63322_c0_g1~~TRINITY_DN63322_c0_g1_i1.p1  ORF type:complete len:635 (-),score=89.56 TRINITY_DN63322_c0_g1_i1:52-1956(-)
METSISLDWSGFDQVVEQVKQAAAEALESRKRELEESIVEERRKLADERKRFKEECQFMYRQYGVEGTEVDSSAEVSQTSNFPTPVKINVGGRMFQTTTTTLQGKHAGEGDSMLAAMFSQRHPNCKDADGNVFIDRNGDRFAHLLDYLVTGNLAYFVNLRRAYRQVRLKTTCGYEESSNQGFCVGLEFEQMLAEAQYFQLRGVIDALQPCMSALPGAATSYGLFQSSGNPPGAIGWTWQHREGSNTERYTVQDNGMITFTEAGTYLIMTRVPGVSSGNSGYAQLMLNGAAVGESWSGNANGYHNMLYFNEVMQIAAGGRLQLRGVELTHSYNMGRALATSFTVVPLEFQTKHVPFVSLRSPAAATGSGAWQWGHKAGNKELVVSAANGTVTFDVDAAGTYLIMVRVPGVASTNNGYVQLTLDDVVVGESWGCDANGYHKTLHINEVLQIGSGAQLRLQNMNLTHSINMNRPMATNLTAVRLGGLSSNQDDSFATLPYTADLPFQSFASFSSTVGAGNGSFWTWTCKTACEEIVTLSADGQVVTIIRPGTYLIMARVPGASSSNNGYAHLLLDDATVGEAWGNDANGYHRMLHFNEILHVGAGGRLRLQNMNLSHSFNMNRGAAASLTVLFLAGQ